MPHVQFKLLHLKSKYVNENSRFKIDDRFIESDSSESESSEGKTLKYHSPTSCWPLIILILNCSDEKPLKPVAADDDDEEAGDRPEDISEKKLKKEKAAALKILEGITGKPIIARNNDADSGSKSQKYVQPRGRSSQEHF